MLGTSTTGVLGLGVGVGSGSGVTTGITGIPPGTTGVPVNELLIITTLSPTVPLSLTVTAYTPPFIPKE